MAIEDTADSGFDIGSAVESVASAMAEKETPAPIENEVTEEEVETEAPATEKAEQPAAPPRTPLAHMMSRTFEPIATPCTPTIRLRARSAVSA